ncbi:ankyrin repeat and SOCS box protein 16-like [Babylonia areolata]|uniref:ankyrin repeat and SOCS box protein 16-like n=1 Tax=Babylonia areolata TaxID=304850 RepID=UPI003FD40FB8
MASASTGFPRVNLAKAYEYSESLHSAVSANDVDTLRQVLALGANPDETYGDQYNSNSKSILHIACGKGFTDCVRVLLEAGAMVEIRDKWGQMPLHYCLCSEFLDTAEVLLQHVGERVREVVGIKQGCHNRSCLFMVALQGCKEGVRLLLQYGANVNDVDSSGNTPLMACLFSTKCSTHKMGAVMALVEAGADLEVKNNRGMTALQVAAGRFDVRMVEYLLSVGADVNSVDCNGRTALTNTIRSNTGLDRDVQSILVMLVQAGADLNSPKVEANALMACLSTHSLHPAMLRFFLDHGADPSVFVGPEVTPLLHALREFDQLSAAIFLQYTCTLETRGRTYGDSDSTPCTVDPMDIAVERGRHTLMRLLLSAGDKAWRSYDRSDAINCWVTELYECGVLNEEEFQWFEDRLFSPPRLSDLAVCQVRSQLGSGLHRKVPLLPVPATVKDAILLTGLADVCD